MALGSDLKGTAKVVPLGLQSENLHKCLLHEKKKGKVAEIDIVRDLEFNQSLAWIWEVFIQEKLWDLSKNSGFGVIFARAVCSNST